jgi:hypothetical protein
MLTTTTAAWLIPENSGIRALFAYDGFIDVRCSIVSFLHAHQMIPSEIVSFLPAPLVWNSSKIRPIASVETDNYNIFF